MRRGRCSAAGDERLRPQQKCFLPNGGVREQVSQLTAGEQPDLVNEMVVIPDLFVQGRSVDKRPHTKSAKYPVGNEARQQMHQRGKEVRFHREVAVGRLHPVTLPHAGDLRRKPRLSLRRPNMLDHRVAENDVERPIGKRQPAAVALHIKKAFWKSLGRARQVDQDDPWPDGKRRPDVRRAPHIEDAALLIDRKPGEERPHARLPELGLQALEHPVGGPPNEVAMNQIFLCIFRICRS